MPAPQKATHHYCGTSRGVSVRASWDLLIQVLLRPGWDLQEPVEQQAEVLPLGHEDQGTRGTSDHLVALNFREVEKGLHDSPVYVLQLQLCTVQLPQF